MTPRMTGFLKWAARCEPGKGLPPKPHDKIIASRAVSAGYGMLMGFGTFMIFVISDEGRAALSKAEASHG